MYIGTLVDDIQKVVDALRTERGEFTLAMLHNSGSLTAASSWNLIVSAPWTDEMGKFDATHLIAQALHDGMDSASQPAISRITVLETTDPFVRDMNFLYPLDPGGSWVPITHVMVEDITEGSGLLLYSKKAKRHKGQV